MPPPPARDDKKEPAVIAAENFMNLLCGGASDPFLSTFDSVISFQSPMGIFFGRPHVKAWIEFEKSILAPFTASIRRKDAVCEDAMKSARLEWSVGGLHFTDVVTQTPLLNVRSIVRTIRRDPKTQQEYDLTERLLLAWTGPHFAKYCSPKAQGVDNHGVMLPTLNYSFQNLTNVRQLLHTTPKDCQAVTDPSYLFHFIQDKGSEDDAANAGGAVAAGHSAANPNASTTSSAHPPPPADFGKRRHTQITIQAKGRNGETNAIIIDKETLTRSHGEVSRMEALEDEEVGHGRDRSLYVCSGIRLDNNNLTQVHELAHVLRIYVVNAFYFLTFLDLSSNKLEEIPDLTQLPSLATLYLHDNKIQSWSEVAKLQRIPNLQSLTLFVNPLQSIGVESPKEYRCFVLLHFFSAEGFPVFRKLTPAAMRDADAADRSGSRLSHSQAASRPPSRALTASNTVVLSSNESSAKGAATAASLQRIKVRLRKLDHNPFSPNEIEATEKFLPTLKGKLKKALKNSQGPPSPTAKA